MRSFLIGRVLEPEVRDVVTQNGRKRVLQLAILSGRVSTQFEVWEDDANYKRYRSFRHDDLVCAVVSDYVSDKGYIRHSLKDLAPCSAELREDFRALFIRDEEQEEAG